MENMDYVFCDVCGEKTTLDRVSWSAWRKYGKKVCIDCER